MRPGPAISLLASAALCWPVFGQADGGRLAQLVEAIDAPELAKREQATAELAELDGLVLMQIDRHLNDPALSVEQRRRLLAVGAVLYAQMPKPGLGVQFGQTHPDGVQLERVVQNGFFPAADVLRAGDIITHADGRRVQESTLFRVLILSHLPGDTMPMTIRRGGETLELAVPLGSFENLGGAASIDMPSARAAYFERRRRLGSGSRRRPIDARFSARVWIDAAYGRGDHHTQPGEGSNGQQGQQTNRVHQPVARIGGRALRIARGAGWTGTPLRDIPRPALVGDDIPGTDLTPELRAQRYAELQRQRTLLMRANASDQNQLGSGQVTEGGQRALIKARMLDRTDRIEQIERMMEELVAPNMQRPEP